MCEVPITEYKVFFMKFHKKILWYLNKEKGISQEKINSIEKTDNVKILLRMVLQNDTHS